MILEYMGISLVSYAIGRYLGKKNAYLPITLNVTADKDGVLDLKQMHEALKAAGFDRVIEK